MSEQVVQERETVVVIDDDYAMRLSCQQILQRMGFRVELFEDGSRGLAGVASLKPALVVVDLKMPGISGLEVVARVHELDPEIIVVVITGFATIGTAVDAMKSGAYDFVPKPFSPDELRVIVNRGLERRRLRHEMKRHEQERELMRRRFVTFVSHQLRTPLVAVHQYLDVLKRLPAGPEGDAKRAEWVERCLVRTDEMQQLIRDWLTLAEAESGSLTRERVEVDLAAVLRSLLEQHESYAEQAGVTLTGELPDGAPVLGDATALCVLFDNLIVNAIKYNRQNGRVAVSLECPDGEAVVSVADTGIGIPEEYREAIFDEFVRVKGEGAKKTTGTGLGLPICKRIAGELGGVIELESHVGEGSTFRVRLPLYAPVQAAVPAEEATGAT
jgi:two-component system sensor histidine kinase/response regulator